MIVTDDPIAAAVAAGYAVVPADQDKRPRVKWGDWQRRPQTDAERRDMGHGSIWGVVTGVLYGITVLDFDGDEGAETMADLGLDPHVETPGGYHVYVQHPGYPVKTNARAFPQYPGMDVRGDGGLAWFAGRSKKGVYRIVGEWPPVPAELSEELAAELFPHPQAQADRAARGTWDGAGNGAEEAVRYLRRCCEEIERALPGSSNAALNKAGYAIGGLVAAGQLDVGYAIVQLTSAAEARGAGDIDVVLASAMARGAEAPWKFDPPEPDEYIDQAAWRALGMVQSKIPEPVPFPVDALPAGLDEFVLAGAEAVSCPPDYIGAAILPAFSVAIGGYVQLKLTEGWQESAHVYTAIVGPPGARKSPSMRLALAPVYAAEQAVYDSAAAKALAAQESGEEWEEIDPPQLIVDDTTIEALFGVLEANPRGVLMRSDELAGWVGGMGQYKGGLGRDRQHWLSIWSRDLIKVSRVKGASRRIPNPFVAVVGSIQPDPLAELMNGRDDGLLPRLLMAQGEFVTPVFNDAGMPPGLVTAYDQLWNEVRDAAMVDQVMELTPEGRSVWATWLNKTHYPTLGKVGPELAGAWAKMDGQAARLALILARIEGLTVVTPDVIDRAIALVRYFQGQASQILSGATTSTSWEKAATSRVKAVGQYLINNAGATKADIAKAFPWAMNRKALDEVLGTLRDVMGLELS